MLLPAKGSGIIFFFFLMLNGPYKGDYFSVWDQGFETIGREHMRAVKI